MGVCTHFQAPGNYFHIVGHYTCLGLRSRTSNHRQICYTCHSLGGWGGFANQISNTTALLSVYTILIIKASTKTRAARHSLKISVVFPNDGQPAWTKCFCCVQCRTECMSLVKFIVDWIHFSVLCGRTMSIPCQTEIFLGKVYTRFCSVARNVSNLHSTYVSPILLALGYIWLKNTAMT